jgi:hypothetical protein
MARFRKKPVEIEAEEVHDLMVIRKLSGAFRTPLPDWVRNEMACGNLIFQEDHLEVQTLEGTMRAGKTDYLIRGVAGEIYPVRRDIFESTYERV